MTEIHVAIVGGGLAGLYSARLLRQAGVGFVVIEARDRLGGRIFTADASGAPSADGFDLGPSWYWPEMQPAIKDLIGELGLSAFSQNSEGDVVFERMSREGRHRYRGHAQAQQSMRLAGGTSALVRALAHDLPRESILLGKRVTSLSLTGDGVELAVVDASGESEIVKAGYVIAALPPRLLEATVRFTPAQDVATVQRWRLTPTWMAPHAKFFALYERPFWRKSGFSGTAQSMVGPMAEIHDATTASGRAALFGFLGVEAAQRSAVGEEALARGCLDQFARIFGNDARTPIATLFKDWATDDLTATAADRAAAGYITPSDAPWVRGAWQLRLALAGSETSPSEAGYLAGAIIAAKRAVTEISDAININGHGN